ncbi:leucine-rich receptor-like kinase family protein [Medicago truncatula]|uniref:Leucine-rich receptor-like kinase family protein n=2 Tax=Medicago truncatula TaxID=3880 RepID=A0A072V488_MEDTR|nr:leucine-rich receptor-like kinase family protein [Medicago truncatula]
MSTLTKLRLSDSSLIGIIPSILGRWKLCKLQVLQLSNNFLTGDITEMIEVVSWSNQSLEMLDLSQNQLNGKLSHSLEQFKSLYDLDLSSNSVNSHTVQYQHL